MLTKNFIQNTQINPKSFTYICLGVVLLLGLLHVFMLFVLFPQQGGSMNLHIPTRSGGYDVLFSTDKFAVVNTVALGAALLLTAIVAGLVRIKKAGLAVGVTFLVLAAGAAYLALFVGSAFSELWGGGLATLGVLSIIGIGFSLEWPLIKWLQQNIKKK